MGEREMIDRYSSKKIILHSLTSVYSKAEPERVQYSHHFIGFNVEPGYGHDEG